MRKNHQEIFLENAILLNATTPSIQQIIVLCLIARRNTTVKVAQVHELIFADHIFLKSLKSILVRSLVLNAAIKKLTNVDLMVM